MHRSKDRIYSIDSSAAATHKSDLLSLAGTDAESLRYFARRKVALALPPSMAWD
jgi:hypothetical protein